MTNGFSVSVILMWASELQRHLPPPTQKKGGSVEKGRSLFCYQVGTEADWQGCLPAA